MGDAIEISEEEVVGYLVKLLGQLGSINPRKYLQFMGKTISELDNLYNSQVQEEILPPKEKEEEEDVQLLLESDSDDEQEEEQEDEEEESDSFEAGDYEPKTYPKGLYDSWCQKNKEPLPAKRRRSPPIILDPDAPEDKTRFIDLAKDDDDCQKIEKDGLVLFKTRMKKNPTALADDPFYSSQFAPIINDLIAQAGNDEKDDHQIVVDNFWDLAMHAFSGDVIGQRQNHGIDKCDFCNINKRYAGTQITINTRKQYVAGRYCLLFVEPFYKFFECLGQLDRTDHKEHFLQLKRLLDKMSEGNEKKKKEGRKGRK